MHVQQQNRNEENDDTTTPNPKGKRMDEPGENERESEQRPGQVATFSSPQRELTAAHKALARAEKVNAGQGLAR